MKVAKSTRPWPAKFAHEYLERLVESSPDIVVAVDRNGSIFFYNDGAEKILGYNAAEILEQNVVRLYPSIDEARRVMAAMRSDEYGGPGKVKNYETIFVDRLGRHIPVAISGSILYDEAGLEMGSIGFAKDLTDIRKHDRLATLGELAIGISHEINTPLEVILNQLSLLDAFIRRKAGDAEAEIEEERVESIRRELGKVESIVHHLEDLARGGDYSTREYLGGAQMTDFGPRRPPSKSSELSGLRVLVVDDDLGVCASLRDLLAAEGCEVAIAGGGLEALRLIDAQTFDIVLSDVVMPDLDGYDLFMEVKRRGPTPVILMTGYYYDKDHVIKRSRLEGVQGVVFKKPIDPARLKEVIRQQSGRAAVPTSPAP